MRIIRSTCVCVSLGLALVALGAPARAQLICEKNGKFKLRAACKTTKGETEVLNLANVPTTADLPPRTRLLGFSSSSFENLLFNDPRTALQIDGSNTSVQFATASANSSVHITFSAECSMGTSDVGDFMDVDITLDSVTLPPTNDDDAFCTSEGDSDNQHWRSDSRTVVATGIPAGAHTLEVSAAIEDALDGDGTIDDKSLSLVIVED